MRIVNVESGEQITGLWLFLSKSELAPFLEDLRALLLRPEIGHRTLVVSEAKSESKRQRRFRVVQIENDDPRTLPESTKALWLDFEVKLQESQVKAITDVIKEIETDGD